MTKLLVLDSSALGASSVSAQLSRDFVASLRAAAPSVSITHRDLDANPLPHLTNARVGGLGGKGETPEAQAMTALSDTLIAELKAADVLVIGAPMYNFGITTMLKAWFDHVLRAGVTFNYTAEGPKGLMTGKRAVIIETRGGVYSSGPANAMDAQEPHLRAMLAFIGITDVTIVRAEGLAMGPEPRTAAIANATAELAALASTTLALAA